ncbi:glycosyl transferase family 90-domain-containing protein [Mycena amicta]|nr:glycosyl transferase family 90-domain-containing protein [Mycena amicta]
MPPSSWLGNASRGAHAESIHPLLPTNGPHDVEDDDLQLELELGRYHVEDDERGFLRKSNWKSYTIIVIVGLLVLAAMTLRRPPKPIPQFIKGPWHDFSSLVNADVDRLLAQQSSTLEQATSRYRLRNRRDPPPGYEQWYSFAQKHSCLVDEYEQISRDFEPFYQLAEDDPTFFSRMAERASTKVKKNGVGMTTGVFKSHKFRLTDSQSTLYSGDWPRTLSRFASFMPDMSIILNGRDEPRSLFNTRKPNMRERALNASDKTPFEISPHPTDSFFRDEMGCIIPNRPTGFTEPANDASGFMLYASSTQFATDLLPVLSMTKISPCFADILVPSEFYYADSNWSPKYPYPDSVNWTDKIPQLYWRGMTSGGHVYKGNYHNFPRFRIVDIARSRRGRKLMDVAISKFHDDLCGKGCNGKKIKAEYGVTDKSAPREEGYKYKYVVDLDGNSFSGRYLGLLRSGSLVFKATVFSEYFNDWIRPYEHYIPILPDLSDLLDKIEWARANDAEARRIQQAGQVFAKRIMTDSQNDCYFSLVLLEWGRLQGMATARATSGTRDGDEGQTVD